MELVAMLEQGHANTARIMAGVGPDQLDLATPCSDWDVRGLLNHIIGGAYFFAAVADTGAPPDMAGDRPDFTAGDMNATYEQAINADVTAWRAPGALERMCHLPFGEMPGQAALGLHFVDNLMHGWDLAKATGQDPSLDPQLAGAALEMVQGSISDDIRGEPGTGAPFGPRIDVAENAPAHDRLAGFLGRQP